MTDGLVAVIPAFNERASLGRLVPRLSRLCPVIVVDDASTDDSRVCAWAAGAACVVSHARRAGKAAALRTGFAEALRCGAALVATLDGDGQHDPDDLPRLVAAARRVPGALIIGDRLAREEGDPVPRARLLAIRSADRAIGWLIGSPVRDSQCGLRIYPAPFLRAVALREAGFVLETEALVRGVGGGYPVISVPVRRIYLPGRASRFRAVADGSRVGWYIAREAVRQAGRRLARAAARDHRRASAVGRVARAEPVP